MEHLLKADRIVIGGAIALGAIASLMPVDRVNAAEADIYTIAPSGTPFQPVTPSLPLPVSVIGGSGTVTGAVSVTGGHIITDVGSTTTAGLSTGSNTVGTVFANVVGTVPTTISGQPVGISITGGTGTVTGTVSTNADGSIAPGAAPSKELVTGGVYNTSKPGPTNGQVMATQFDSAGNQNVAIAPSPDVLNQVAPVVGVAASQVIKGSAGGMMEVHFSNYTTATQMFAFVFNGTAIPANGAVTAGIASTNYQECAALNPQGVVTFGNRIGPYEKFANGIVAAVSTNAAGCLSLTSASSGYFINGSAQ